MNGNKILTISLQLFIEITRKQKLQVLKGNNRIK